MASGEREPAIPQPTLGRMGFGDTISTMNTIALLTLTGAALAMPVSDEPLSPIKPGAWHAWLECPGGDLPFGFEIAPTEQGLRAWLINGTEHIEIPSVTVARTNASFEIDYYDSKITCDVSQDGERLDGTWRKRRRGATWTEMPFHATWGLQPRFAFTPPERIRLPRRWRVQFSQSPDFAVADFAVRKTGLAEGTFMTTTGDYRFLAGCWDGRLLKLSCFDGAHAFLFAAELKSGILNGDFWSSDTWHETWTATPDSKAALPSAFDMTKWDNAIKLDDLVYRDLDGMRRSLAAPEFTGQARLIEIFGTWCPNCHDASNYLVELDRRFGPRGLKILGLAFEHSGDFERDARQVRIYTRRHGITYPILIAGTSAKDQASAAVPLLDRVRSYPTTIFVDRTNTVRAVHTGFTGPATGREYESLRTEFETLIETMLRE